MTTKRSKRKRQEAKQQAAQQMERNQLLRKLLAEALLTEFHDAQREDFKATIRGIRWKSPVVLTKDNRTPTRQLAADVQGLLDTGSQIGKHHYFLLNYLGLAKSWCKPPGEGDSGWLPDLRISTDLVVDVACALIETASLAASDYCTPDGGYALLDISRPRLSVQDVLPPQQWAIHTEPAREAKTVIDGVPRPVFRMAHVRHGMHSQLQWLSLEPSKLGLQGREPLPVYIQSHTLWRLRERINDKVWGLNSALSGSVLKEHPRKYRGDWRIPFRFSSKSQCLGYFTMQPADVYQPREGRSRPDQVRGLVLTTFLFITMDNTPEGDMLRREWRMHKHDLQYYGLDKLTSLTTTDLLEHPATADVFRKVGLGKLIDDVRDFRKMIGRTEHAAIAQQIAEYAGLAGAGT